nr:double C2-like domain-containing protein gamma isoform X2 [Camelus dromedarius]
MHKAWSVQGNQEEKCGHGAKGPPLQARCVVPRGHASVMAMLWLSCGSPQVRCTPSASREPEHQSGWRSSQSATLGTLEFTLLFDADNSTLHCTAHHAQGLKPPASGSVDTYVKANLLPGASKASQLRTRTVRGTRGPVWEETLTYHGFTLQDAQRKTLWLCVCEDSRLRRRRRATPLGELRVPLRKLVPNRARSFNVCLEKRRLTKRPKSLDAARGMSLYEEVGRRDPHRDGGGTRWRWRQLGRTAGASCCLCATVLSAAGCWWVCCAVPTLPPWMPTATRTPLSAFSCIQMWGRNLNTRPVFGRRP